MGNPAPTFAKASGVVPGAYGTNQIAALVATNRNNAARWLQISDSAGAPASGAVPSYQFLVPASSQLQIGKQILGRSFAFAQGLSWGFSTLPGSFTAGTDADHDMQVML